MVEIVHYPSVKPQPEVQVHDGRFNFRGPDVLLLFKGLNPHIPRQHERPKKLPTVNISHCIIQIQRIQIVNLMRLGGDLFPPPTRAAQVIPGPKRHRHDSHIILFRFFRYNVSSNAGNSPVPTPDDNL